MSEPCCGGNCSSSSPKTSGVSSAPAPPLYSSALRRSVIAGLFIGVGWILDWRGFAVAAVAAYLVSIAVTVPTPARRAWASLRRRS